MPDDFWTEAARMLTSGAIVAAAAAPVGLLAWAVVRGRREPLLPRWRAWWVPWGGFEVVAAFLVLAVLLPEAVLLGLNLSGFYERVYGPDFPPPTGPGQPDGPTPEARAAVAGAPVVAGTREAGETAAVVRRLWAGAVSLPVQLGLLLVARRTVYRAWKSPTRPGVASLVALAVVAWAVFTPLVMAFHAAVNLIFDALNWTPDKHQLTRLGGRPVLDSALFLFQVCVAAPAVEEAVFRGLILGWVVGARRDPVVPATAPRFRPWIVATVAVLFAAMSGRPGPVLFALALLAGLAVVVTGFRAKRRAAGGVWASAALFAAVHSGVWPSPIPLFLLALGLGWLAVRTRGVLVPVIVHGLFNAVSAVYVLRGGAG